MEQLAEANEELRRTLDGLTKAMASRAVIEQAKGIVMAIRACSADDAFEALARMSQRENVKVRHLAEKIVNDAQSRFLPYDLGSGSGDRPDA